MMKMSSFIKIWMNSLCVWKLSELFPSKAIKYKQRIYNIIPHLKIYNSWLFLINNLKQVV